MKTFSVIVTVQATDLAAAQAAVAPIIQLEQGDQHSEAVITVGAVLPLDAQQTINDLAGELTRLGFGFPDASINGAGTVDVINDNWRELSLMSTDEHTTTVG